jgi:thiosulfate sulfurtransferase
MSTYKHINSADTHALIELGKVELVDIRDAESFRQAHIEQAHLINNENVQDFIREADLDRALVVYCYHGNSSQGAAQFFSEQGFEEVYTLDGGFEAWRQNHPISP